MMSGVSHDELLDVVSSNKLMPVMGNLFVGVLGKGMMTGSSMPGSQPRRRGIIVIERS